MSFKAYKFKKIFIFTQKGHWLFNNTLETMGADNSYCGCPGGKFNFKNPYPNDFGLCFRVLTF